jgi:hypothetical protein
MGWSFTQIKEVYGRFIANATIPEAIAMFNSVQGNLSINLKSQKGRERNVAELSWRSAADLMRAAVKKGRGKRALPGSEEDNNNDSSDSHQ